MRAVHLVVIAFVPSLVACAADAPSESTTDQHATILNRIAVNAISTNRIAVNRIAVNRIAVNRIAVNRIAVNTITTQDLLNTEGGREVFSYLVSCALPADVTLVATVGASTFDFKGSIGLAPRWVDRRLNAREKGWISACMLARVNAHGVSLLISLRGAHPALTVSSAEAAAYTQEEGAFYGDIFTPAPQPLVMISCRGAAQAAGETGGLVDRDCAEPSEIPGISQCGFTYAGDCANYTTGVSAFACESRRNSSGQGDDQDGEGDGGDYQDSSPNAVGGDQGGDPQAGDLHDGDHHDGEDDGKGVTGAGYYLKCHSTSTTGHWPHTSPRYDQVITVYVSPGSAPLPQ